MKDKLKNECPECGSTNVIYKRNEDQLVCQDCGTIFEELGPEDEEELEEVMEEKVPSHGKKKKRK